MGPFLVLQALWLFVPAYVGNMGPVFAMRLFPRWKAPLDGGREWRDGRPLLGAGKTWRGIVAGSLFGMAFATAQSHVRYTRWDLSDFGGTASGGYVGPLVLGFGLGFGAVAGDAVKSFFKRRTGRPGGARWVPFDQLDFVLGALLFAWLASLLLEVTGLLGFNWWTREFAGARWPILLSLLLLTPGLHFLVNGIGYKLKLKDVPW